MTSASELFYNRRSRGGRSAEPSLGLHALASDRDRPHLRHSLLLRRHINRLARRRDSEATRQRGALMPSDPELDRLNDAGFGDPGTRTGVHSAPIAVQRLNWLLSRSTGQLPISVLEARARLVERLRGFPIAQSRQVEEASGAVSVDEEVESGRLSSSSLLLAQSLLGGRSGNTSRISTRPISMLWDGLPDYDDILEEELMESGSVNDPGFSRYYHRSPGLDWETIHNLPREAFIDEDGDVQLLCECCICLESFWEGDRLLRLHCGHRFHSACLEPWLRTCGDCPYCRTRIHPLIHKNSSSS